jgi:hypothetical protein
MPRPPERWVESKPCPKCGAEMRHGTVVDAELSEPMPVWRCIRCGEEVPR